MKAQHFYASTGSNNLKSNGSRHLRRFRALWLLGPLALVGGCTHEPETSNGSFALAEGDDGDAEGDQVDGPPATFRTSGPTSCTPGTDPHQCLCPGFPTPATVHVEPVSFAVDHRPSPVDLLVYSPVGATGTLPVIVWSHGGGFWGSGPAPGAAWSRSLAASGYLVIGILHSDPAYDPSICGSADENLFVDAAGVPYMDYTSGWNCSLFVASGGAGVLGNLTSYVKVRDTFQVVDELAAVISAYEVARNEELTFDIDTDKVGVAGHSGGTSAVLTLAGAQRHHDGATLAMMDFTHPLPSAFMAMSPLVPPFVASPASFGSTPQAGGWAYDSFSAIDRAVLSGTGVDDVVTTGTMTMTFENMAFLHELMPPTGGKARVFLDWTGVVHGDFNLGSSFPEVDTWLEHIGFAFFEATLNGDTAMASWLNDGDIVGAINDGTTPATPASGLAMIPDTWCHKRPGTSCCIF